MVFNILRIFIHVHWRNLMQRPGNTGNIFLQLSSNIVALQVEKRCCTYYHPPQTLSRNKISLLKVEAAFFNKFFQLSTMFEVSGNTANNAFQLAMQQCCVASCSYYFTLSLKSGFSTVTPALYTHFLFILIKLFLNVNNY